jgi:hypothetical protein
LIAVDHPLKLVQFVDEIGAAEFDFLAGAAWARGIGVDGHRQAFRFANLRKAMGKLAAAIGRTILTCAARKQNPLAGAEIAMD